MSQYNYTIAFYIIYQRDCEHYLGIRITFFNKEAQIQTINKLYEKIIHYILKELKQKCKHSSIISKITYLKLQINIISS